MEKIEKKIKNSVKNITNDPLEGLLMTSINPDFETFINQVGKTFLDLSFQRDGGWNENDKLSFLKSTKSVGQILAAIYICDINECYKNSPDEVTKIYFFDLLQKGWKYLSIDGNNRSKTLLSCKDTIINDNWTLLSNSILVIKITRIRKSGIPVLFNYLNSGLKQTNQVMRNTYSYDLSSVVREVSKKYQSVSLFSKYSGKNNEELVSRCIMLVDNYVKSDKKSNFISLEAEPLNKFFKDNNEGLKIQPNTIEILNNILSRMDDIILPNEHILKSKKGIRLGQVYFLNIFMLFLMDYRTTKINNVEFIKSFISIEMKCRLPKDCPYQISTKDHSIKHVEYRYGVIKSNMIKHECNFVIPIGEALLV